MKRRRIVSRVEAGAFPRGGVEVEKLLLKPEEAAEALGVGRTKLYELISAGVIDSVRIGSSRRVPVAALEEFVVRLQSGNPLVGGNGQSRRDPIGDALGG